MCTYHSVCAPAPRPGSRSRARTCTAPSRWLSPSGPAAGSRSVRPFPSPARCLPGANQSLCPAKREIERWEFELMVHVVSRAQPVAQCCDGDHPEATPYRQEDNVFCVAPGWPRTVSVLQVLLTSRLCFQTTAGGGSGAYLTVQVRFIVEPLLINKSGPPLISVTGSWRGRWPPPGGSDRRAVWQQSGSVPGHSRQNERWKWREKREVKGYNE